MATRVCVLDGGGPKDSENTLNSFLTNRHNDVFWQIGADMVNGGYMVNWLTNFGVGGCVDMLCMPIVVGVVIVINIVHLETELVKANTTFGVRFGYMFIWLQEDIHKIRTWRWDKFR